MLGRRPRPAGGAASEGTPGDRAGGGCSSAHAGPPAANFCGLRGGRSGCVGRRSPPPPGPQPRARSCVCSSVPSCLCSHAARSRPAHPGAAPAGKPSLVSLPRVPAAGDRGCCSCARARNVVTAGTRWPGAVFHVAGPELRARVRLGPAYGGLDGVNHSPPHTLTMRGMWTSAATLHPGLKDFEKLRNFGHLRLSSLGTKADLEEASITQKGGH